MFFKVFVNFFARFDANRLEPCFFFLDGFLFQGIFRSVRLKSDRFRVRVRSNEDRHCHDAKSTGIRHDSSETIRFVRALGYKIVDHHADIGIASLQNDFFFSERMTTRIDAGQDALTGCFFIA